MRHNGPVRVLAAMASRVGRVVHTGVRQYYGTVSQPPPGVENTQYTPDIIIFDCPSPGKVMVGDVTIPHPLRPSEAIRVRQHQGRVLKMAERAAKDKERKVRSFLDALYAEKAILPPADSQFVALPVETYGAVHPDVKRLFDWLINTWIEQTLATPSQAAIYRHEWKCRFSMSIQLWNAQALRDGTADAVLADAAY